MRLEQNEISAIKSAVFDFDDLAKVFLFGSRVDDHAKGGDIDVLVLSQAISRREQIAIKRAIFDQIGEQKIDLIVESDLSQPFTRLILEKAILL